jgi:hypothetical protein
MLGSGQDRNLADPLYIVVIDDRFCSLPGLYDGTWTLQRRAILLLKPGMQSQKTSNRTVKHLDTDAQIWEASD